MNLMAKELATINLFIIVLIIFGGFLLLRVLKNRLGD